MMKVPMLVTIALGLHIQSGMAADAAKGQQLAVRWCAGCHAVAAEVTRSTDTPPAFVSIARRPDFDQNRLAFFLLDPHPVMPNMSLSRSEAADLAAYIASLKK